MPQREGHRCGGISAESSTEASVRTVPIVGELRRILLEHRLLTGRVGEGLVVEKRGGGVESGDSLAWRAEKAWKAAGPERVTMHAARHSYTSMMILARVNIVALSRFMGHSSITIKIDRYATCTRMSGRPPSPHSMR